MSETIMSGYGLASSSKKDFGDGYVFTVLMNSFPEKILQWLWSMWWSSIKTTLSLSSLMFKTLKKLITIVNGFRFWYTEFLLAEFDSTVAVVC